MNLATEELMNPLLQQATTDSSQHLDPRGHSLKYSRSTGGIISRLYVLFGFIFMITGEVYSAQCVSTPTFLVVGCKTSTDTATDTCTTDSVSITNNKFELTGYFKIDTSSTFSCSNAFGDPASFTATSYSVITSLHFGTSNYLALAVKPTATPNNYIAIVLKYNGSAIIETVLGTLTSNAGFVQICNLHSNLRWKLYGNDQSQIHCLHELQQQVSG